MTGGGYARERRGTMNDLDVIVSLRGRQISSVEPSKILALAEPPVGSPEEVTELDLSDNELQSPLIGMDHFCFLRKLDLSHNSIDSIRHMPRNLTHLNVSFNKLTSISGLEALPSLRELDVSYNMMVSLEGLSQNIRLRVLKASGNHLNLIEGLEHLRDLQILDLTRNEFTTLTNIRCLSLNTSLKELRLKGNPVCSAPNYRAKVIHLVPGLMNLDDVPLPRSPHPGSAKKRAGPGSGARLPAPSNTSNAAVIKYLKNSPEKIRASIGSAAVTTPRSTAGRPETVSIYDDVPSEAGPSVAGEDWVVRELVEQLNIVKKELDEVKAKASTTKDIMQKEIDKGKFHLQKVNQEKVAVSTRLHDVEAELETLKSEKDKVVKSYRSNNEALERAIVRCEQEISSAHLENQRLKDESAANASRYQAMYEENKVMRERMAEMQEKWDILTWEKDDYWKQSRAVKETMGAELDAMRKQVAELRTESEHAYRMSCNEKSELMKEIGMLKTQLSEHMNHGESSIVIQELRNKVELAEHEKLEAVAEARTYKNYARSLEQQRRPDSAPPVGSPAKNLSGLIDEDGDKATAFLEKYITPNTEQLAVDSNTAAMQ